MSETSAFQKSEKDSESVFTYWLKNNHEGIKALRLNPQGVSDSLGDLGAFIPLLVGMASMNGPNIPSALFFGGVFNVITGIAFGIPRAGQTMKAIAAHVSFWNSKNG